MKITNYFWLLMGGGITLNLILYFFGAVESLPHVNPVLVQMQLALVFFYLSLPRDEE